MLSPLVVPAVRICPNESLPVPFVGSKEEFPGPGSPRLGETSLGTVMLGVMGQAGHRMGDADPSSGQSLQWSHREMTKAQLSWGLFLSWWDMKGDRAVPSPLGDGMAEGFRGVVGAGEDLSGWERDVWAGEMQEKP